MARNTNLRVGLLILFQNYILFGISRSTTVLNYLIVLNWSQATTTTPSNRQNERWSSYSVVTSTIVLSEELTLVGNGLEPEYTYRRQHSSWYDLPSPSSPDNTKLRPSIRFLPGLISRFMAGPDLTNHRWWGCSRKPRPMFISSQFLSSKSISIWLTHLPRTTGMGIGLCQEWLIDRAIRSLVCCKLLRLHSVLDIRQRKLLI